MAMKENNRLFNENIKDANGLFYHLDEDEKKHKVAKPEKKVETSERKEMTLDEFKKLDSTFNESMFITKVNNMFVKFFTNIMMDRLPEVNHFVSDKVYEYGESIINAVKSKGWRQMYDELNVKESKIKALNSQIELMNPDNILERGYSIVFNDKGQIVRNAYELNLGDEINVKFSKGYIKSKVEEI